MRAAKNRHCLVDKHVDHFINTQLDHIPPRGQGVFLEIDDLTVLVHRDPDNPKTVRVETKDSRNPAATRRSTCSDRPHKVKRYALKACEWAFTESLKRRYEGGPVKVHEPDGPFTASMLTMSTISHDNPFPQDVTGVIQAFLATDFHNLDLDQVHHHGPGQIPDRRETQLR